MESTKSERLLNDIGILLAEDTEYPRDQTLLYAEVASNTVGSSVFKDIGNAIVYRVSERLWDKLQELWDQQQSSPPWCAIEYFIRDDRFEVKYTYPYDPDWQGECDLDYREKVVARYFGDKPIVYPPMPTGDQTFKL